MNLVIICGRSVVACPAAQGSLRNSRCNESRHNLTIPLCRDRSLLYPRRQIFEQHMEGTRMSNRFTRRRFIVTAGAAASTVLGSSIFNLESVWAAPVCRNLGGMSASDPVLVSYRKAIKAIGPAHVQPAELGLSGRYSWHNSCGFTSRMEHLRARNSFLLVLASHVSLLV